MELKVKIENTQQLKIAIEYDNVREIIISRDSFAESELPKLVKTIKSKGKSAWILMERISRYEEFKKQELRLSTDKILEIKELDGIIIQNLDCFSYILRKINKAANDKLKVELNYTMNCYNLETKKVFEELYNEKRENHKNVPLLFTAPVELNIYELEDVKYDSFIIYSYVDTMVSANCLRKNTLNAEQITHSNSSRQQHRAELREPDKACRGEHCELACINRFDFEKVQDFSSFVVDRKGKKLHYKTYCKYCYNKIFNVEPLYLIDKIDELDFYRIRYISKSASETFYRIDFSFESEKEVRDILNKKVPYSFTRGHIKNSIK